MITKIDDVEKMQLRQMHRKIMATWQRNVDNCKYIYECKAAEMVHPEVYKMILEELNVINGACVCVLDRIEGLEEVGINGKTD